MRVIALDHMVLTVADIAATVAFYQGLGMEPVSFGDGRTALSFGAQKINLHRAAEPIAPHAAAPTPGSADLCLIVDTPADALLDRLAAMGLAVELGPVPRTGATGPLVSVYLRDPDGNLVELASPAGAG